MLLKKGSTGEEVKALQRFLGLADDGNFGPGTEAAVKTWQEKQGLVADGIVGNATYERMGLGSVHITEAAAPSVPAAAGNVNLAKLKGHVPDAVIAQIPDVMTKFGIDTAKIDTCSKSEAVALLKLDETNANENSVSGSPTILINGVKYKIIL